MGLFHKHSILDRQLKQKAYRVNHENQDKVHEKEVAYWNGRRERGHETQVRAGLVDNEPVE